jgi:hypothetical protein
LNRDAVMEEDEKVFQKASKIDHSISSFCQITYTWGMNSSRTSPSNLKCDILKF